MVDLVTPVVSAIIGAKVGAIVGGVLAHLLGRKGLEKQIRSLEDQTKALREQNESLKKIAESQEKRIEILGKEFQKISQLMETQHKDKYDLEKQKMEGGKTKDIARGAWEFLKEMDYI